MEMVGADSLLKVQFKGQLERQPIQSESAPTMEIPVPNYVSTVIFSPTVRFADFSILFLLFPLISSIKWLTKPEDSVWVFEFYFTAEEQSIKELRGKMIDFGKTSFIEVAIQKNNVYRKQKRMVIFDMDSTLIHQECIDELARECGVYEKIASITESAMRGEIDFNESLRQRVGLLAGQPIEIIEAVRQRIEFKPGAKDLCKALKKLGFTLAVVSGGFMPLANHVKAILGLDYAFANTLCLDESERNLIGTVTDPIINGEKKAELLGYIAQIENISREQICAVGDGANDLAMLSKASVGVAYNAKPKVQEQAMIRLNQASLLNFLYYLGYTSQDIQDLLH
jgi:phosphoserine phosphatase SerB